MALNILIHNVQEQKKKLRPKTYIFIKTDDIFPTTCCLQSSVIITEQQVQEGTGEITVQTIRNYFQVTAQRETAIPVLPITVSLISYF